MRALYGSSRITLLHIYKDMSTGILIIEFESESEKRHALFTACMGLPVAGLAMRMPHDVPCSGGSRCPAAMRPRYREPRERRAVRLPCGGDLRKFRYL